MSTVNTAGDPDSHLSRTELVVALDYPTVAFAEELMESLKGLPVIYKVGFELFMAAGPQWVKRQVDSGFRVFLDLKFHDIPNTVGSAVIQAGKMGVEFVTLHLSGGKRMLDEVDGKVQEAMVSGQLERRPKILGVTVLTSFHEEEWIANVSHMAKVSAVRSIADSALHFASLANDHPIVDGVVCSPQEVDAIRTKYPKLFLMVPGIRPKGFNVNDQSRVMTPAEARSLRASAVVVGRPITQAPEPRVVAEAILQELS